MIPSRPNLSPTSREALRAPLPPNAGARRSAETAREMIGAMRERFGTAPLVDRRATGHLDASALIAQAPSMANLEAVVVPPADAVALGPARRTPTSKLRLC